MANIRKGDLVQVITGQTRERGGDRGKQGRVIGVQADKNRVIVEGVNFVTKHVRVGQTQRGTKTGGIETMEAPIHVSNIALVDPATKMPARVGFTIETDDRGKTVRVRYFKKSKRVETKKSIAARGTKAEKPADSEKSAAEKPAKVTAKATDAPAAKTAAKAKTPKKDAAETAEKDSD